MNPITSNPNTRSRSNPFSTKFVRPGAIEFLANQPEFLRSVLDSFRKNNFRGQILGPHGCGKTTLTFALEKELSDEFDSFRRVTIRNSREIQSNEGYPRSDEIDRAIQKQLLIIDGFERLPWLHQRLLIKSCGSRQIALMITTHRWIRGVPLLCELKPDLETLIQLVKRLSPEFRVEPSILKSIFQRNHGDIRESLMSMYDWFEHRQR